MSHLEIRTPADLQAVMRASFAPSAQQFAAITAPLEPGVVIAGAGSGKTTLMAARVVYLVATGQVRPDQVLGLTFTTKAAGELGQRVRAALRDAGLLRASADAQAAESEEPEVLEPTVATYNAYAAALLTEQGIRIGHEPDTRVLADASRYQLAARAVATYTGRVERLSDHPQTVITWLLGLDSQLSEHLCSPQVLREFQETARRGFTEALATSRAKKDLQAALDCIDRREELLGLVEAYRALKRRHGVMEFSDQIERSALLADRHPDVGAGEREKFRVVLLDEYQDTSVAQALLLSRLFSGPDASAGRGHPVTAVGDPNQAIYGWRGASVSNILRFGEDFPRADGSTVVARFPLTVNRRSDRRILQVANALAAPLYAADDSGPSEVASVRLEPAESAEDGEVTTAVHPSYDEELAALPDQIRAAWEGVARRRWNEVAVLTRDNAHAADVFHVLSAAEIPVEIVGLKGLLALPEVSEVVATLTLVHDLTANAALLTLLSGPRWAIGPRDLALLGRRAKELAGPDRSRDRSRSQTLREQLEVATAAVDPADLPCLHDALDDPGDAAYSAEARERFAMLSEELRRLRPHAGEPLLDLVRRIVDVTGIDIELASAVSPAAAARRDNLDLFLKAVADFQAVDGDVSLAALLAYLEAEDEFGAGLDVATPTEADSVKLLTVHRAKGLEYDAVFLVGVAAKKFPPERGRSRWPTGVAVLPNPLRGDARDLPVLRGWTKQDLETFTQESRAHDAQEELRLGYVALTRPRHLLSVTSYLWAAGKARPNGPSPYQVTVRDQIESWGGTVDQWLDVPPAGEPNPLESDSRTAPWPVETLGAEVVRRREAAALVRAAADDGVLPLDVGLTREESDLVAHWDAELETLLTEARAARADEVPVSLPTSLSATALARLRDDPAGFAEALARPMPRRPSPEARFGTRFHAWVEQHYTTARQLDLVEPDELPGRADAGIEDDEDLRLLTERFLAGPLAHRSGAAVEVPFALVLAGQVVRGRIDAVFPEEDGGWLVVDWKTGRRETADPLQLALYRLAWADLVGVDVDQVRAGFCFVRDGRLVEYADLPGREALEQVLRQPSIPSATW